MIQKVMFYLFFFQTDFLEAFCKSYGEQPGYLVGGGRGRITCGILYIVVGCGVRETRRKIPQ